jgi:hypothetical protein
MNMKLNPNLTQQQTSDIYQHYEHPWYKFNKDNAKKAELIKPNPPSKEAVERAKFVDKTYHWDGGIRSGSKRTSE